MTEQEAAGELEGLCRQQGSSGPSFETIVLFGPRSALPHGVPSGARLRRGDWVLMDFGCMIDGFCSDMTRTSVAGGASGRQREIYNAVLLAQAKGRDAVRAGVAASDIDKAARDSIAAHGFGDHFGHATGHGVGRRIHEAPRVASNSHVKLGDGAVVTVEPGVYIDGFGGVRIEDMVAATPGGAHLLTRSPRHLVEIDL
jgi:Xaa-Pro aminopeptidase